MRSQVWLSGVPIPRGSRGWDSLSEMRVTVLLALLVLALGAVTMAQGQVCSADTQCVPAQCCHAAACVHESARPDCAATICSMSCDPNTLDCGQGRCACASNGTCVAEIGTPTPATQGGTCRADTDCVAATCCHSTSCVHVSAAPTCDGVACTEVCQFGTVQCDRRCTCNAGQCATDLRAGAQPPPLVPSLSGAAGLLQAATLLPLVALALLA